MTTDEEMDALQVLMQKQSVAIYIAVEPEVANDIASSLKRASALITELRTRLSRIETAIVSGFNGGSLRDSAIILRYSSYETADTAFNAIHEMALNYPSERRSAIVR
jgi:hypothetical protein